jgi:predicted nucleotidyltransferase
MGTKRRRRPGKPATQRTRLADALFSKVQQRVLGVLFAQPSRSFYVKEVIALASSGAGAVQRELARLESSGLVTSTPVGRQRHYQANSESPLFQELHSLALKTFGLVDVLREALEPMARQIDAAFVFGSVAKGGDTAHSDIDVFVISDGITYGDLFGLVEGASQRLGRKVSPTIYDRKEFLRQRREKNAFVTRVLAQPKLWLIGDERSLGA